MQVSIELPDDIARHLATEWKDLSRAALESLALEAYRSHKLSTEQLRRLLGFETRYELDGFLKQHEVWLEYSLEDFDREGEISSRLWQKRQAEMQQEARPERPIE